MTAVVLPIGERLREKKRLLFKGCVYATLRGETGPQRLKEGVFLGEWMEFSGSERPPPIGNKSPLEVTQERVGLWWCLWSVRCGVHSLPLQAPELDLPLERTLPFQGQGLKGHFSRCPYEKTQSVLWALRDTES